MDGCRPRGRLPQRENLLRVGQRQWIDHAAYRYMHIPANLHLFPRRHTLRDGDHGDHPTANQYSKQHLTSKTTHLAPRRIRRNRRHILDPSNTHPRARQRTERALCARAGRLRARPARRADLDVQRGDAHLAAARGDVLRGEHGRVRRGLVSVRLNLHPTYKLYQHSVSGVV